MASTDLDVTIDEPKARPARRRRLGRGRWAVLLVAPALLLGACKPSTVVTTVIDTVGDVFGLGKNEIATPQFEITNGIKVQVVIKAPEGQAGVPVVVHVRCSGGTHASQTVTLQDSGDLSLGQTTFTQGWPAGADCLVSQEVVKGVEVASATVKWVNGALLQANFLNR